MLHLAVLVDIIPIEKKVSTFSFILGKSDPPEKCMKFVNYNEYVVWKVLDTDHIFGIVVTDVYHISKSIICLVFPKYHQSWIKLTYKFILDSVFFLFQFIQLCYGTLLETRPSEPQYVWLGFYWQMASLEKNVRRISYSVAAVEEFFSVNGFIEWSANVFGSLGA